MPTSILIGGRNYKWDGSPPKGLISDKASWTVDFHKDFRWLTDRDHIYPSELLPGDLCEDLRTEYIGTWGRHDRLVYVTLLGKKKHGKWKTFYDDDDKPVLVLLVCPWQKCRRYFKGHDWFVLGDWSELKPDVQYLTNFHTHMGKQMTKDQGLDKIDVFELADEPKKCGLLWAFLAMYLDGCWDLAEVVDEYIKI